MTISEAIPYLLQKHWIRRKSWRSPCCIAMFGGVWQTYGFTTIFEEDIEADDWEVIPFDTGGEK